MRREYNRRQDIRGEANKIEQYKIEEQRTAYNRIAYNKNRREDNTTQNNITHDIKRRQHKNFNDQKERKIEGWAKKKKTTKQYKCKRTQYNK